MLLSPYLFNRPAVLREPRVCVFLALLFTNYFASFSGDTKIQTHVLLSEISNFQEDAEGPADARQENREHFWNKQFQAFAVAVGVFALLTTMITYGVVLLITHARPEGRRINEDDSDANYFADQNRTMVESD